MSLADGSSTVERVGIVGAGVIGSGWALHFMRMGCDVLVYDPAPGTADRLRRLVDARWPTLERLGLRPRSSPDRLQVIPALEDTVSQVDVVQESSPEVIERKIELYARMDAVAGPDVVLLSSTSGLSITAMQSRCRHPERAAVGHPFNPPYILPLVEIVGGQRTDPATVAWAENFYREHDKHPVCLDVEMPGFLATRLQEALWREMLHIVADGQATVEQLDAAVAYGPGLRWAVIGPALAFHLGGGAGGMAHTLEQFGPTLKEPWSRLDAPELTDELRRRLIDGCDREAAGRSIEELTAALDDCLIEIMIALDRCRGAVRDSSPRE